MTLFNSVLSAYSTKVNGQIIDASDVNNLQTDVTQIEAILGQAGNNSVVGTYEYFVKSPASNGGGHIQSANKGGTGQTAYNKGDILVGQTTSVLTKLAVGTNGLALIADSTQATGIRWGVPGNTPTTRVYSVNGAVSSVYTWVKPANLSFIVVQVQGPGGGGASVFANNNVAKGGGGGGYVYKIFPASVLNATEIIMVGNGGLPSSLTGSILSSFGITNPAASLVANTGNTGTLGAGNSSGGTAFGGDINIIGGTSKKAGVISTSGFGGDGGDAVLGFGGSGGITNVSGAQSPTGFGGGGGSSSADGSGNTTPPTAGANGVVIIQEY